MSQVDDQIARAAEVIDRTRANSLGRSTRSRKARQTEIGRRIARIAIVDAAILVAAVVVGFFIPLGMFGALAVMALLIAATVVLALAPAAPEVRAETLPSTPLRTLPLQTEAWLDRQRPARRHLVGVGRPHDQRAQAAHLLVQQPDGVALGVVGPERVRADEFGQAVRPMRLGAAHGAHLVDHRAVPGFGHLPGGLGSGETAADDVDDLCHV